VALMEIVFGFAHELISSGSEDGKGDESERE